jgi:hypothetical protein
MTEQKIVKRRRTPSALEKIIRDLDKAAPDAVAGLVTLAKSLDEKIKLDACKAILNIRDDMQDKAEKRELQLMIVQHKTGNGVQREEEDDTPEVDFENLQKIS